MTADLQSIVRFKTKQNSIWSKALIMPLIIWKCVLSHKHKIIFSENQLAVPKITFITECPGTNFLLPTCLTGGK